MATAELVKASRTLPTPSNLSARRRSERISSLANALALAQSSAS
jgi:hypothetical protein